MGLEEAWASALGGHSWVVCVQPTDSCVTTREAGSGSAPERRAVGGGEMYAVVSDN